MPDTEQTTRQPNKRKKDKKRQSLLTPILILLIILAGAGLYFLSKPKQQQNSSRDNLQPPVITEQIQVPEKSHSTFEPTIAETPVQDEPEPGPGEPMHIEEPGIPGPVLPDETALQQQAINDECELLGNKLYNFFIHIDSEEYMKPFALEEPSLSYFTRLAHKLLDNPPVVSRESDDLYTILRNMAHFFRVIGKDNIMIIKAILDRERDKVEDVASELYQWIILGNCQSDRLEFSTSLEKVYEYAGFFLNTMGGRSYLFRRDSRSRLLVNYYSILIVASANEKGLNRHGIDLSLHIPQLIGEIEATSQLIYKENYLDQLAALEEKYQ